MGRLSRKKLAMEMEDLEQNILLETAKRREAEKVLNNLCSPRSISSSKALTLQTLLKDIETIKEDKKSIREWLERGVSEAERVSGQLSQISEELYQTKERENMIKNSIREMNESYSKLQESLHETNIQVRSIEHQLKEKEDAYAIEIVQNNSNKVENFPFLEELKSIKKELEELRCKESMIETAETSMDCLAACSRRALHELGKFSVSINSNNINKDSWNNFKEFENKNDSFDSEDDADETHYPPVILAAAKAMIDRCDSCLCTIWSGLSRIAFDHAHHRRQEDIHFEEAYAAVERDFKTTIEKCSEHLQHLRNQKDKWENKYKTFHYLVSELEMTDNKIEVSKIRSQIEDNKEKNNDVLEKEINEADGSFACITRSKNILLEEENHKLKLSNEELRKKLDDSMSDYHSVKELKHAYRDLELKKTELARLNAKLRAENRAMKLYAWESDEKKKKKV